MVPVVVTRGLAAGGFCCDMMVMKKSCVAVNRKTTNNRMELMAAIKGLEALKEQCVVDLTTDSVYVKNGITEWIHNWKAKNWQTSAKKPVKNVDLWQLLDEQVSKHDVSWHWVKGHSGHAENERVDALANRGIDEMDL